MLVLSLLCLGTVAWAEDGEVEPPPSADATTDAAPNGTPRVSEDVVRLGRVEMVLLENDDPESALEFAQEIIDEGHDSARVRMLIGACMMRLERYGEAVEQFSQARRQAGADNGVALQALYNVARARVGAGQLGEAVTAYRQYITFAQEHRDLESFVEDAQRIVSALERRTPAPSTERRR